MENLQQVLDTADKLNQLLMADIDGAVRINVVIDYLKRNGLTEQQYIDYIIARRNGVHKEFVDKLKIELIKAKF